MNDKILNTNIAKINRYDELMYNSGPVSISDYMSDKYNDVHDQIYAKALAAYIEESAMDESEYRFIEVKPTEFWKPSSVMVIMKKKPFSKKLVDLTPYWEDYKFDNKYDFKCIKIDKDENLTNSMVVEIDYLRGKVKMYNKVADMYFYVGFDRVDKNTELSDDDLLLTDTFTYERYKSTEI